MRTLFQVIFYVPWFYFNKFKKVKHLDTYIYLINILALMNLGKENKAAIRSRQHNNSSSEQSFRQKSWNRSRKLLRHISNYKEKDKKTNFETGLKLANSISPLPEKSTHFSIDSMNCIINQNKQKPRSSNPQASAFKFSQILVPNYHIDNDKSVCRSGTISGHLPNANKIGLIFPLHSIEPDMKNIRSSADDLVIISGIKRRPNLDVFRRHSIAPESTQSISTLVETPSLTIPKTKNAHCRYIR
jgi:hypothetical protein